MNNFAFFVFGWIDFPQFFDPNAIVLGIFARTQVEFLNQPLTQVAAATFREQSIFGVQLHAGHVAVFLASVGSNTHVAGHNTLNAAIFVIKYIRSGKAGVDFCSHAFCLLCQPAAEVAETDDVVAFIVHGLGDGETRYFGRLFRTGHVVDVVASDRSVQRCAHLFPVGKQLVQSRGLEDRARKDVGADFGAFFYYTHADVLAGAFAQLANFTGRSQTRRTSADDQDVKLHRFAFHSLSPLIPSSAQPL